MDVIALPFITDLENTLAEYPVEEWMKYKNHLKIGGCKITEDGSPQGKTAFFTTPYLTGGPSGETNWRGEPTFPPEMFNKMVKTCYDLGVQLYVHTNGDAAGDLALKAHELAAADDLDADRRTVLVHSQFVRNDQLAKYVAYKMVPSFYTEHTFFFSAAHVANRGPEQTSRISPMANPSATYCVEQGGTYEFRQTDKGVVGFCILPEGSEVGAWEYFRAQKS